MTPPKAHLNAQVTEGTEPLLFLSGSNTGGFGIRVSVLKGGSFHNS